ncbi:MAG: Do family serine endopeptidase [Porticoccaceae bacterium]|nr:Do family serine endopeptidase [Porticoccaceae bacterium]
MVKNFVRLCFSLVIFQAQAYAALPDFATLVEDVAPAVVKINTMGSTTPAVDMPSLQGQIPEIFRELLEQRQRPARPSQTMGSGFVVSSDGFILTNHHVVEGADKIQVQFADRREFLATIVGSDRTSDLALLKIDATNLLSVKFAKPESTRVGEWVIAIGSPFGLDYSVTAGIVSAIGRSLPTENGENYVPFIQTDVAINRGNSGGPLFNLDGEVVGINSQIYSPTGGSVGLSFSIPVSIATNVVEQLRENGQVSRGFLGVGIENVSKDLAQALGMPGPMGAVINSVAPKSAAAKGGLLEGDVVVSINGQSILYASDLPHIVGLIEPDSAVKIEIFREGKRKKLSLKVGSLPGSNLAQTKQSDDGDLLGLRIDDIPQDELRALNLAGGIEVISVAGDSPADKTGLQQGDIIVQLGFSKITDVDQYVNITAELPTQTPVAVRFYRQGRAIFRTITLEEN